MDISVFQLGFATAVIAGILLLTQHRRIVVYPWQKGLLYRKGAFEKILGQGVYHIHRHQSHIQIVDIRDQITKISAQEMLTADKISVKLSQNLIFAVIDPIKAVHTSTDYSLHLQQQAQMILRGLVAGISLDDILEQRQTLDDALNKALATKAGELGLAIKTAGIKDIILPAGLKKACAGVAEARKDAQRQLEKARGEQALLRSLANTAKLYQEHPMLLNTRLIQSLGDGQNSVVFKAETTSTGLQSFKP